MLACILSFSTLFTGAFGCNLDDGEDDIVIDDNKVQIYVSNYNGGVGKAWLDKIITDFESEYSNYEVEYNGKTYVGVQIVPNNHKQEMFDDVTAEYDEVLNSESKLDSAETSKRYLIGNKLYVWKGGEWRSRVLVSKTVQYIGTIDMVNNVNIDYDSFNEIYLNIPAGVGGSTSVYFDNNVFDKNYEKGEIINVSNDDYCTDIDYIIGRDPEKLNSSDVTLRALYDSQFEQEFGYVSPTYKINNGYCINFNDDIYSGGSIEEMNLNSEEDFEFNCVLIYYRIRKGDGKWYTNLYGVLFLEEVSTSDYNINLNEDNERAGYIQRYPKFKKGNSWGLKLDLKIDAQPDSQMELRDKEYVDPNEGGSGMQMFTEALMQLNDCVKVFYEVKKENTDIEERLYKLENIVSGVDTMFELRDSVNILRTRVEMFQPTLNSLEGRIETIESRITRLETNLGHLIRDFAVNKELTNRVVKIEDILDDVVEETSDSDSDE